MYSRPTAAPQLRELRDPADDEREQHLRDDLAVDGAAEAEQVREEPVPRLGVAVQVEFVKSKF
jgi:hypothetical protein